MKPTLGCFAEKTELTIDHSNKGLESEHWPPERLSQNRLLSKDFQAQKSRGESPEVSNVFTVF